ncbi:MAG: glycoside hydrolase family 3 C-terminal domain-containing protein [Candidatus Pristimantibacillus lignocellulolyticus]|uniref:Glycoside hydrolase family 3 C-terminal domain-containing protein n=1 Tax=Candidatus Pristimantibacillus lignocellulolyticus TaxID=2994561 RepID=A0A9J6ZGR9_9BACL|nr:MAG: glycoside hydrolase family 3 C-terminal domain-containing protein [Candidatus Pristimantibacillus lignocellulolyticus]
MLGLWHTVVATPLMKMKMQFKVTKKADYTLDIVTEPLAIPIQIETLIKEDNRLHGTAKAFWRPGEQIIVELEFGEDRFTGSIQLPGLGTIPLEGERGRGPSLSDALIEQVKPYRKDAVKERTEEEIRVAVDEMLVRMSLEDKIGQMFQVTSSNFSFGGAVETEPPEKLIAEGRAGSVLGAFDVNRVFELQKIAVEQSPHRIPLLFNADVIHGSQTIFPIPLAWSCSWDPDMIKGACQISAKEASASGTVYNHGPMIDIGRDPRWGRVSEGAGEDPYLGSLIAKAQVEGFQGDTLFDQETIVACLKHFIGYGAAEGGRDYNTVDMSEATMRNSYLSPFQAGLQAGAGSVMNAFNIYEGVPVAASKKVMKDLLRDELGFDGVLISDYGAVDEIVVHGHAEDVKEAAKLAVDATMDIEMATRSFEHLPQLVQEGKLSEKQIEDAARRILTLKYKLGLMDDPFRYIRPEKEAEYHFHEDHLKASLELARKSIVLLKNDGVLPLKNKESKIALIGPFADSRDLLGPWQFSRFGHETVTVYEGLQSKGIAEEQLLYAKGSGVIEPIEGGIEEALLMAEQADVVILALGENSDMSGEAASRMSIELPDAQKKLAEALQAIGKPIVLVLTNGRPLALDWFDQKMNAIVETWFLGSQAGHAIADMLMGDFNPSGKLTMSFPIHTGQIPVYYNHFRTGRPLTKENQHQKYISKYLDGSNDPLYPFGFGLSYTQFEYSDMELDRSQISAGESIRLSVKVSNLGVYDGEEIVQLYIQDCCGSIVRPVKELKGFHKVSIAKGETEIVEFSINESDLTFWTPSAGYTVEPGKFIAFVGTSSAKWLATEFTFV